MLLHHYAIQTPLERFGPPALLTLAIAISLHNHTRYYLVIEIVALLLCLVSVIYYYASQYARGIVLPRTLSFFLYLAFFIWASLSILWSGAQITTLLTLKSFLGGLLAIIIGYGYTSVHVKIQLQLLLLLGLSLALYTLYQAGVLHINRPAGLLLDWNTHAAFLCLLLLPLCAYFLTQVTITQQCIVGLLSTILFTAISLTLSRGAFLSLAIGLALLSSYVIKQQLKTITLVKLFAWLFLGYILAEILNHHETFSSRLQNTLTTDVEALGSGRHRQWQPAWEMFLDKPFLGWGLGTFHLLFAQYRAPLTAEAGFYAHNDYLQFLLELGPSGLALFLAFIISLMLIAIRLLKAPTAPKGAIRQYYCFTLLAACLGMLVHAALNFNLYQLPLQLVFGLYIGCVLNYLYANQTQCYPAQTISKSRYFSLLSGISVPIIILLSSILGSVCYEQKIAQTTDQNIKVDYAWKAQLFLPLLTLFDYQKTLQLITLLKTTPLSVEDKQHITDMGLELIDQAISKNSLNPENYLAKAQLLQLNNPQNIYNKKINTCYQQALKHNPYALSIRDQYASYLLTQHKTEQALEILWDAWNRHTVDFYQNGIVYLTHLRHINQQLGKTETNMLIDNEVNKLIALQKIKPAGIFVLKK